MPAIRNLIPPDPEISEQPELAFLRAQADFLSKREKGLILGRVETAPIQGPTTFLDPDGHGETKGFAFLSTFYLEIPDRRYTYELFSVYHSLDDFFPAKILWREFRNIADEIEFESALEEIFTDPGTNRVIGALRKMAKERPAEA